MIRYIILMDYSLSRSIALKEYLEKLTTFLITTKLFFVVFAVIVNFLNYMQISVEGVLVYIIPALIGILFYGLVEKSIKNWINFNELSVEYQNLSFFLKILFPIISSVLYFFCPCLIFLFPFIYN